MILTLTMEGDLVRVVGMLRTGNLWADVNTLVEPGAKLDTISYEVLRLAAEHAGQLRVDITDEGALVVSKG